MKQWEKPKLIVLVRGKPEEAILGYCKYYFLGYQSGANYADNLCDVNVVPGGCGVNCQGQSVS